MTKDIEKPDSFYLGKIIDSKTEKPTDNLLFYESKNLNTHAVCVGMTGSGKTGLGIAVLEEAGLHQIPAIIIDPKGDLTNLLLTFPHLLPSEFLPWIDREEAEKKGMTAENYAEFIAKTWKDGLKSSLEDESRIQKLKNNVDMMIYTPASNAGVPLSILSSFKAPPESLRSDQEFMRERVLSLTSSLLGLLGIDADPIKSREHIMISTIIDQAFKKGDDLDIASLIKQIQTPNFDKLGAMDLETFFPQKERTALSIKLNGLLASTSFQAWMQGEPLQIQDLLYTKDNKPKLSILSIAHLSDNERMFFVTLLLNEFIIWMRRQSGTSSLKAILYMDEIFGYFPPTAMPPSKLPMLTLLKTARAFGVGIFLCTQNPVDLDYKALANCGTWFIGKLQTERDKMRVLDGLRIASNGELNTATLDKLISSIKKRTFIMRSIYEKEPVVFETRWTLSYLKGPLTLPQIESLTPKSDRKEVISNEIKQDFVKPIVAQNIVQYFMNSSNFLKSSQYKPFVLGSAKLHFIDAKNKIDTWQNVSYLCPVDQESKSITLNKAEKFLEKDKLDKEPAINSSFDSIPSGLLQEKNLLLFQKAFSAFLYQNESLKLFSLQELGLISKPDESKEDFLKRAKDLLNDKNEEAIKKIESKFSEKIAAIEVKIKRSDEKVSTQKQQSFIQKIEAFISFLSTCIQAVLGKKLTKGTISQVGVSMRRATRITKESQDVANAEDSLKTYEEQRDDLIKQQQLEVTRIKESSNAILEKIEEITIASRKSDITVDDIALVWIN